jgi:predicted RNA-binding Zn-ribbon protein involved in translation (DUF1610 family)
VSLERIAAKLDRVVIEPDVRCKACVGTGKIVSLPSGYVVACPDCGASGVVREVGR